MRAVQLFLAFREHGNYHFLLISVELFLKLDFKESSALPPCLVPPLDTTDTSSRCGRALRVVVELAIIGSWLLLKMTLSSSLTVSVSEGLMINASSREKFLIIFSSYVWSRCRGMVPCVLFAGKFFKPITEAEVSGVLSRFLVGSCPHPINVTFCIERGKGEGCKHIASLILPITSTTTTPWICLLS